MIVLIRLRPLKSCPVGPIFWRVGNDSLFRNFLNVYYTYSCTMVYKIMYKYMYIKCIPYSLV